jgi:Flp pilus assembly protein TadG
MQLHHIVYDHPTTISLKVNDMKVTNQNGQALVELALSLFLLVLLIFGAFEFGRVMYIQNTLNYAARLGARLASVSNPLNVASIQSTVILSVPASLQTGLSVNVTPAAPTSGLTVTVVVTKPFTTVVPLLITQLSGITLSAQASMMYE